MRCPLLALALTFACGDDIRPLPPEPGTVRLSRSFRTPDFGGCFLASPLAITSRGENQVLVVNGDGTIAAIDPLGGATRWSVTLPAGAGTVPNVAATPVVTGSRVAVAWQEVLSDFTRTAHHVSVVDLEARALDPLMPALTLESTRPDAGGTGVVTFDPRYAYSRSALPIAYPPGAVLGVTYVGYGNIQDIQPWHGWVFEVDLDAWLAGGPGAAVTAVLLTTPESDCGPPGQSGSLEMICGAGVWAPAGPQVFPVANADGYELIVPTGNGQLDLGRGDYANTLMRVRRGLAFDPACDPDACAGWDVLAPDPACVESCADLFIPRLLPGQPMLDPPDGRCDGVSFFACYASLDYDLGADAPARVQVPGGPLVYVLPAKDGAVYLIDAEHMGTLYDREIIMPVCGSGGGSCSANWAGMMVTEPLMTTLDDEPLAIIPTFIHDTSHPAGLVALRVTGGATPRLEKVWEAPGFDTGEALDRFRRHAGRAALLELGDQEYALVVDVAGNGGDGTLLVVRVSDGEIVDRVTLDGRGQRYVEPLVSGGRIYVTSCEGDGGPGHVEGFGLVQPAAAP